MSVNPLSVPLPKGPDFTMVFANPDDVPTWHDSAVCAQTDPEALFPEKGGSTRSGKSICIKCPVKQECLDYALDKDERFGIWGGLSERERRRLKRSGKWRKLLQVPVQDNQLVTFEERPMAMKDTDRFPMVRAYLQNRQGQPLIVHGGDRGKVPGDLAQISKIDNVKELRQVLRKMGRIEADTKVTEDPDGTLWVELVKEEMPSQLQVASLLTRRIPEQAASKPVVAKSIFSNDVRNGPLIVEDELQPVNEAIEDLAFDSEVPEQAPFNVELLEAEIDEVSEELSTQLQAELEAELASSEGPTSNDNPNEDKAVIDATPATVARVITPVFADILTPRVEISKSFVEMQLPDGYINPATPSSRLLLPSSERIFAALSYLDLQPQSIVRGRSITPEIQKILGVSSGAASSFVSHLVAEGFIGRVLNGKITRVIWLRQSGWNWLQEYVRNDATSTPMTSTWQPKKEDEADIAEPQVIPASLEVSRAYGVYPASTTPEGEGDAVSNAISAVPHHMAINRRPNELQLAKDFQLDIHALTKCYAILGQRGSGKTSTGVVMAEEMIAQGWPVAIIDPQGVWYGLRSSESGKDVGLPVIIFGGSHGDVPLYHTDGYLLAEIMEAGYYSIIIDTSEMFDDEAMQTLMTDFFTGLYHRRRRLPMHLIVDEADEIVPQSGFSKELVIAATRLTKRGRTRGIGSSWISQRPQDLNKKILTQAEVLLAMRLMHQLDIKAIEEWIGKNADVSESKRIRSTLASLPTGTGWFWSPAWMGDMRRINMRRRLTFDTSGTPLPGLFAPEPEVIAWVDLALIPETFLARLSKQDERPSDESYAFALDEIRLLAPKAIEAESIDGKLRETDEQEEIVATTSAVIPDEALANVPEAIPLVSLLAKDEVAELISLRAQIGAMTHVMTDALRQRGEAYEDLQALHAEYRSNLVQLQEEIASLKAGLSQQQTKLSNRVRELVEQVRAREIEVARLEAHLLRHEMPIYSRHILAIVTDEDTA